METTFSSNKQADWQCTNRRWDDVNADWYTHLGGEVCSRTGPSHREKQREGRTPTHVRAHRKREVLNTCYETGVSYKYKFYIYNWLPSHRFERRDSVPLAFTSQQRPSAITVLYYTWGLFETKRCFNTIRPLQKKKKSDTKLTTRILFNKPSTTPVATTVLHCTWGLLETKRSVIRFVLIRIFSIKSWREVRVTVFCLIRPSIPLVATIFYIFFILHVGIVRD